MRALSLVVPLLLCACSAWAASPELRLPLECRLGDNCWLMNYPDTEAGPAVRDFRCQGRSYDGHDGTDVAVRDRAANAVVVAPAAGIVAGLRDGEPDGAYLSGGRAAMNGKECGNGVLLRHADGWETQLCHLRAGSLTVRPGQAVQAGERLGLVGLSGMSEFPHVHMSVRRDGAKLDPFTGADLAQGCGVKGAALWVPPVEYRPGVVYAVGFRDHIPAGDALKADAGSPASMAAAVPALVLWGTMFGIEPGDVVRLVLRAPDGSFALSRETEPQAKAQAWRMEAAGVKAAPGGLAAGIWQGDIALLRGGREIDRRSARIEVR